MLACRVDRNFGEIAPSPVVGCCYFAELAWNLKVIVKACSKISAVTEGIA